MSSEASDSSRIRDLERRVVFLELALNSILARGPLALRRHVSQEVGLAIGQALEQVAPVVSSSSASSGSRAQEQGECP